MRVRLTPSTAALLHVGQARTALLTYLLARRHGGTVLLRLDDADPERTRADHAGAAEYDLRWLGLSWDELARQSERLGRYAAAAERLKASGRLYPCFESDEELNAKREMRVRRHQPTLYDRAMLQMTPAQRASAEAGGKRPYWRFLLSGVAVEWGDMVLGKQEVKISAVSDPVLIRADGTPMQAFTSAVDDLEDGITHIVRGDEQLTASGVQLDLRAALGGGGRAGRVRLAHLPALAGADGAPLTRRVPTLRSLRGDGIEPAALAGYLARLGTPDEPAPVAADVLAGAYDLSRVSRSAPVFDGARLAGLNRRALGALPFEAVRERLPPAATPAFWMAIRGKIDLLGEARGWWDVVAGTIVPPLLEGEGAFLLAARDALPAEPWDRTVWEAWTAALQAATGRRGKQLVEPLHQALTGEEQGPELRELLPLMGRARAVERLRLAAS